MRILKALLVVVVLAVLGVAGFVGTYKPAQRLAPEIRIEQTPERVARGEYLARNVLGCVGCHTRSDWTRFNGPPIGPEGAGGDVWGAESGIPGTLPIPNITPHEATGIGAWSDGEILRAIREGVGRDGEGLFPSMPYKGYAFLSDEDAQAIVAFLRTLPAVENAVPDKAIDFPVSFFVKMAPAPITGPVTAPARTDLVGYGRYLATIAGCAYCHTPVDDRKRPIPDRMLAGGQVFKGPWGELRSPNLTPHATGLGDRSKENLIALFRSFAQMPDGPVPPEQNTVMPWRVYRGMTDEDLGAIYAFLGSVPPIDHAVERRKLPEAPPKSS